MLIYKASTSTGTGPEVNCSPGVTTVGVQWTADSTKVNYEVKGSVNGTDFVSLVAAATGRTGSPTVHTSTQGPVNFLQILCTINTSTSAIAAHVAADNAVLSRGQGW